jgi:hypothetical protein
LNISKKIIKKRKMEEQFEEDEFLQDLDTLELDD